MTSNSHQDRKELMDASQRLIDRLQDAAAYLHPIRDIHTLETHSAWVILTGDFAYKIKKPVNFGFLDFSTVEKRLRNCALEVELNQRYSPDIYLSVEKIYADGADLVIGGPARGQVVEYAVKMRQFQENCLLSDLAEKSQLTIAQIDELCDRIAAFHQSADVATVDSNFASVATVSHWILENFQHIQSAEKALSAVESLGDIEQWVRGQLTFLSNRIEKRKQLGFVRNCHGDLHLKNITLHDGKVQLFDCIEFNAELRWIDVINEIAFLLMDLQERELHAFANRFLNRYLQATGDYCGLALLPLYLVYRALVRAKVALLRSQQVARESIEFSHAETEYHQYIGFIRARLVQAKPYLIITVGFSGSGKSTLVSQLNEQLGTIQIRSDIERKRMQGLQAQQKSGSSINQGIYSASQTDATYEHLNQLATAVLDAGYPVVLDATFLQNRYRSAVKELADRQQVPLIILHCTASIVTLQQRINQREQKGGDPSEATHSVLDYQQTHWQPLTSEEAMLTLTVDTEKDQHVAEAIRQIQARVGQINAG